MKKRGRISIDSTSSGVSAVEVFELKEYKKKSVYISDEYNIHNEI